MRGGRGNTVKRTRGQQQRESFNFQMGTTSLDSDASFASSRPSSIGMNNNNNNNLYTDRNYQSSAIRAINNFLSSHSFQTLPLPPSKPSLSLLISLQLKTSLKPSNPSSRFSIFSSLNSKMICFSLPNPLIALSKSTNPLSALPIPSHNWPTYLAVVHWLVHIVGYKDHLAHDSRSLVENNAMHMYALDSYLNYIHGDDDSVEALDRDFKEKMENERDSVSENVRVLEATFGELEAKVEGLRTGLTEKETLEKERSMLEQDVNKFDAMIAEFNGRIAAMEKVIQEKEKEKAAKEEERRKIQEENEEMRKRVELQTFNARDVERMKRELQAVERDINEAEIERNAWEEKAWDLDSSIGHKFKELEAIAMECNQAIRRLLN